MKRAPLRVLIQVTAPLVAILTLMLGMRVGAGEAVRAAVVLGARPGKPAPDGKTRLAWQVLTFLDDRGVKETIPMRGLSVHARAAGGAEARWSGDSNADGVMEATLVLDAFRPGDDLDLDVTMTGEPEPLASGRVRWSASGSRLDDHGGPDAGAGGRTWSGGAVRPTVRKGEVGLDVVVDGERLVPGFPTQVWFRVSAPPGAAATRFDVEAAPEPGLLADATRTKVCPTSAAQAGAPQGWAVLPMTAQAHVVASGFAVREHDGHEAAPRGEWFGPMPVAPGAFFIAVPRHVPAVTPSAARLVAPNPRHVVYAELHDEEGRVAAAALEVAVEKDDPSPVARFELPALVPGLYWVVASGEPRGGEHLSGAAATRAFLVGDAIPGGGDVKDWCGSLGPFLAQQHAVGVPRWVALDGLPQRSAKNRARYRQGMAIGLISLLSAALLEVLLLVAAARETRIALQLAELEGDGDGDARDGEGRRERAPTASPPGGTLAIGLLMAVLGFALLAVLLVVRG